MVTQGIPLHAQTSSFDVYKVIPVHLRSPVLLKCLRNRVTVPGANILGSLTEAKAVWATLQTGVPDDVNIVRLIDDPQGVKVPYFENGNILEYYLAHPNTNLIAMLSECTRSVKYIHEKGVIHGNICCCNFLIDNSGHAYLTDIGIHEALRVDNFSSTWRYLPFTFQYAEDERLVITETHEVYAFGMMIYELYTGSKPFPHLKDRPQTLLRIMDGLPALTQPPRMPDNIWEIVLYCTGNVDPQPTMSGVEQRLVLIANHGG